MLQEIPQSDSAAFLAQIQLSPQGSSRHGVIAIGQHGKYNIASDMLLSNSQIRACDPAMCRLDSLCVGPAAQSPWLGKARAAGAQSGQIVFAYSWPSKDAETAQVLTHTGATFGLI